MFGFINLNKPRNLGSRTAINSVVQLVRPQKVGHAGTLDPLASGVLVTAIGPATRLVRFIQDADKQYVGSFRLGLTSDTEDISGAVSHVEAAPVVSEQQLIAALGQFIGTIEQTPPQFSALKVDGVRAYKLARRGTEVKLKSRRVEIYSLELTQFKFPDFELTIRCSGGTYVRTLGRDVAKAVGSDAVMTALRRTAVGPFDVENSVSPEVLNAENLSEYVIPPQSMIPQLDHVTIDDRACQQFVNAVAWQPPTPMTNAQYLAVDRQDRLIAVIKRQPDGSYTPKLNFIHYWNRD